jgi:integrase
MNDMAFATVDGYRKILEHVWSPEIGASPLEDVRYSELLAIAGDHAATKKSYNNIISCLRCAFEYGYNDTPLAPNPARALKCMRIMKKDQPVIDPFSVEEAEHLIAGIHRDWGEAQGNYDEFRFCTGLRPSEQIALLVTDCDLNAATINVTKARVMSKNKDRTKTSVDRLVELYPRAMQVLQRQLSLRARMKLAGQIRHEEVFFQEDGSQITNLTYPYVRWRYTLQRLKARYREPYNARHTSVSWNLMIGKNPLWVATQHGHSVHTMLQKYAAWLRGATEATIEGIKRALEVSPRPPALSTEVRFKQPRRPAFGSHLAIENDGISVTHGNVKENGLVLRGIRTLEGLLTLTPLAGVRLRPLGHLSASVKALTLQ